MAGELRFVALGGVGEIGMNAYLYGYRDRWLLVDLGIGFADDRLPGAEIVLPDPRFLEAEKDRLAGLVLTHAHEDHLGAVPYLWPRLGCPIWCTRFAAAVLRRKRSARMCTSAASKLSIEARRRAIAARRRSGSWRSRNVPLSILYSSSPPSARATNSTRLSC